MQDMEDRGATMLTDATVGDIADGILRDTLRGNGYKEVTVHSGLDHDGDPALFIDAVLEKDVPAVRGEIINSALASLREALLERDEGRFPYLRLVHPDDVSAAEVKDSGPHGRPRRSHG